VDLAEVRITPLMASFSCSSRSSAAASASASTSLITFAERPGMSIVSVTIPSASRS